MRIAILQSPIFPMNVAVCGGLERVEIEEVTRLRKLGHDASLYVTAVTGDEKPVWLKTINDWGWQNRYLKWKYPLHLVVSNYRADIYHGHYTPQLALIAGKKAILHFHGFVVSELPLYRYRRARERYYQAHYVFCAKHLLETYRGLYPDLPDDHLHVIYNGVDIQQFTPNIGERVPGPIRFSYHGRWAENKGITYLLEAIKILESRRTDFECYIAGSADVGLSQDGKKLTNKIKEMSKGLKTVRFPGVIQYSDLPLFLQKMDFSVVPSIYPDPFPLVPLENMACGLPVIAFDIGGLRESVISGGTGFLVENKSSIRLAEAIECLINNNALLLQMRTNARKHVEQNFTWDKHVDQIEKLYHDIANKKCQNINSVS